MKFKENAIKHTMIERGIRLKDLAELTGISKATLSGVANGKTCNRGTAEKICVALKCNLSEIAKEV